MTQERKASISWALNRSCIFVCFFIFFVTYFAHNVAAFVSYDPKKLWKMRTLFTHLGLDEEYLFNELDKRDLFQTPKQALIPVICRRKRRKRFRGKRSGCLVRNCRRVANLPLPSVLLANVQSLDNKLDKLKASISYQQDIKNCNILCFSESWLNNDMNNIQLVDCTLYRQDRTAASGKTRGGGLCIQLVYDI